ncbi:MAG: D-aminopeptidase [Proteobacteria bacterium]|nr:D-aminopeptidase [Pseudomonadota bacterium]
MSVAARLDRVLKSLPQTYAGPGGAVAIVKDGEVLLRHAWGWANLERRIPFTPKTQFRICSITKQFTCGLVVDAFPDPSVLDADVKARLPLLEGAVPQTLHLCHNQSGLKDYWAVAMLQGALAETPFGNREAARLIAATRGLQFTPGTRYSYANQNFRILSDILEARTGRAYSELVKARIFEHAGMETAFIAADTRSMPDGGDGYEGTVDSGFRPAANGMFWAGGDASIGATLDDMIAWERFIDATRADADGLYRRISRPVAFGDGTPAAYGFGLARDKMFGRAVTRHGGALRGWRSQRLHMESERLSVVVLFNHNASPGDAAKELVAAVLGIDEPIAEGNPPKPAWLGTYIEPETGLFVRVAQSDARTLSLRYLNGPVDLKLQADGSAKEDGGELTLRPSAEGLWFDVPEDNQRSLLIPADGTPAMDIAGTYRCDELGAELSIADAGGQLYAACAGVLGEGRMEQLQPIGKDIWAMPCPRGVDHFPPGDWTLAVQREGKDIKSIRVGCWLARQFSYTPKV